MTTQFATRLSLISFATVAFRGLLSQSDFPGTIQTALVSLGAFYLLGLAVGEAARRVVEESVKAELITHLDAAAAAGKSARPS